MPTSFVKGDLFQRDGLRAMALGEDTSVQLIVFEAYVPGAAVARP